MQRLFYARMNVMVEIVFLPVLNVVCLYNVHTISVIYCTHLCTKYSLGISDFLEEISSLSHSIIFLYFFALFTWAFLSLLAILWNSAFRRVYLFLLCVLHLFFSQLFLRPPQTTILPFCISFSWGWSCSPPSAQCPLSVIAPCFLFPFIAKLFGRV